MANPQQIRDQLDKQIDKLQQQQDLDTCANNVFQEEVRSQLEVAAAQQRVFDATTLRLEAEREPLHRKKVENDAVFIVAVRLGINDSSVQKLMEENGASKQQVKQLDDQLSTIDNQLRDVTQKKQALQQTSKVAVQQSLAKEGWVAKLAEQRAAKKQELLQ